MQKLLVRSGEMMMMMMMGVMRWISMPALWGPFSRLQDGEWITGFRYY